MEYLPTFLTVAIIHFLAVVSPGPDFLLITRNSLIYSKKTGIYSALGLGLGILVHVAYCLIGIGLIISQSIVLFSVIKYLGAGYLIYIGYKSLTSRPTHKTGENIDAKKDLDKLSAIKTGFITNVTNPKATLFFLSLFTVVIKPNTPFLIKTLMGAEMAVVTFLWFSFIAIIFSHNILTKRIVRIQHYAEKFIGILLIGLGVKVALFK